MTTIALVGDSHTQIIFPMLREILEKAGYTIVLQESNAGWSSKRYIQDGIVDRLKAANPDLTIFSLGGNNQDLSSDFKKTVFSLLNHGQYYWVSPTTALRDNVEKRHLWTHRTLKNMMPNPRYINIRKITETGHRDDDVHYTRDHYQKIANYIGKRFRQKRADKFVAPLVLLPHFYLLYTLLR